MEENRTNLTAGNNAPIAAADTPPTNPYQAPYSPLYGRPRTPLRTQAGIESAGKWRRFFNYVIDGVAVYVIVLVLSMVMAMLNPHGFLRWAQGLNVFEEYLIGTLLMMAYYIPLEAGFGATFGKLLTGTRVVNEYGEKPNFVQVVLRTTCRIIPFEAFSVLFTSEGRGWHDSLPGTYVVRKSE